MNKASPAVKKAIIDTIKTQINKNDPPETKQTYFRLLGEGFSEKDVYSYLAQALSYEMYAMMKNGRKYNHANYAKLISRLPHLD